MFALMAIALLGDRDLGSIRSCGGRTVAVTNPRQADLAGS